MLHSQKTSFDCYLERKLQDADFRARFEAADHAWDIALQFAALRQARGLTQKQVAELLGTKQQAIARLEDPSYSGHSLSMVRRYVEALGASLDVVVVPAETSTNYDDLEVRQIVAGKNASIFDLIRPLYVTAVLGGEAHTLAGWVLALDGSPARGMVLVDGLRGAGGIRWRYGRSKRLSARQVDVVLAYIRSLPDYDKPGYYVDGARREL